jgi:hypothetical protein
MKEKVFRLLKTYPLFVLLLPVFFVIHGYNNFYPLVPLRESLTLMIFYTGAALILYAMSRLFFRSWHKSALFVFLVFCSNFFFGPVHDWLRSSFPGSLFTRYSFLLPLLLFFFITLAVVLKKKSNPLNRVIFYLNFLFLVLPAYDIIQLAIKKTKTAAADGLQKDGFKNCVDCNKPDIYLILADEYAGSKQLKDVFNFDNSAFENELKKRGFRIVDSSLSNYNYTMFSAPSLLNMDYLSGIEGRNRSVHDRGISTEVMKNNRVFRFFELAGYETYNYSIFDIKGQPSFAQSSFLPVQTRPLVSQTFLYRIQRDLWFHLVTDLKSVKAERSLRYLDKTNNEKFLELTKKTARTKTAKPKFVYTHLMMPHYPYYFDKDGRETEYRYLAEEYGTDDNRYISYLQYCNRVFLNLIDELNTASAQKPVILFISDHGFKSFKNNVRNESCFLNFNALSLPDTSYALFYKGLSNVNHFRILLNSRFGQQLPLLKDSVSFIIE